MQCPQRALSSWNAASKAHIRTRAQSRRPVVFPIRLTCGLSRRTGSATPAWSVWTRQIEGVGFADGGDTHVYGARESNAVAEAWAARACASST